MLYGSDLVRLLPPTQRFAAQVERWRSADGCFHEVESWLLSSRTLPVVAIRTSGVFRYRVPTTGKKGRSAKPTVSVNVSSKRAVKIPKVRAHSRVRY